MSTLYFPPWAIFQPREVVESMIDIKEIRKALPKNEYQLRIRKIMGRVAFDYALRVNPERLKIEEVADQLNLILHIATIEEPVSTIPATWWDWFKKRWFPLWVLRRFPIQYTEIIVAHKFPELSVPDQLLGHEFVHLTVRDMPPEKGPNR
mgnify:CR=1 FL=1